MNTSLMVEPIGFIRTTMRVKFDSPSQPKDSDEQRNSIELLPQRNFEHALSDLSGFDRIWLVWWFHRNKAWRPMVLPPRGEAKRRGVFATRSPHRPNSIGISAVRLLGIDGLTLCVGNVDLVDGTPILDIKPYIPEIDSFPSSSTGWLEEVAAFYESPAAFSLSFSEAATEQLDWLKTQWQINFMDRVTEILTRDPSVHRTRRIRHIASGLHRMGCGAWGVYFYVNGLEVTIDSVEAGYPERLLESPGYERVPDRDAQRAFKKCWPSRSC